MDNESQVDRGAGSIQPAGPPPTERDSSVWVPEGGSSRTRTGRVVSSWMAITTITRSVTG